MPSGPQHPRRPPVPPGEELQLVPGSRHLPERHARGFVALPKVELRGPYVRHNRRHGVTLVAGPPAPCAPSQGPRVDANGMAFSPRKPCTHRPCYGRPWSARLIFQLCLQLSASILMAMQRLAGHIARGWSLRGAAASLGLDGARGFGTSGVGEPGMDSFVLDREVGERAHAGTVGRGDGTAPRFYKKVGVVHSEEHQGWHVTLDKRILKTPLRKPLVIPTYSLALGVAAEWEWQDSKDLRAFMMPLMTLCVTSIDQVPTTRGAVTDTLLRYFHTDAIFCRDEAGTPLAVRQAELWDPLAQWVSERLDSPVSVSDSIFGVEQPAATVEALRHYLNGLDDWRLAGVDSLAAAGRSVCISLATAEGRLGVQQAIQAARLEEDFQIDGWGLVEGGHDIDQADINVRMSAPSVYLRLLQERKTEERLI
mmetsp:Transcript_62119/g.196469  ORF Transcript_62119/g.196469 Transcript_62119/m.196469 type:complete len:424 (+) Transcript_62119:1047-2318(+)